MNLLDAIHQQLLGTPMLLDPDTLPPSRYEDDWNGGLIESDGVFDFCVQRRGGDRGAYAEQSRKKYAFYIMGGDRTCRLAWNTAGLQSRGALRDPDDPLVQQAQALFRQVDPTFTIQHQPYPTV